MSSVPIVGMRFSGSLGTWIRPVRRMCVCGRIGCRMSGPNARSRSSYMDGPRPDRGMYRNKITIAFSVCECCGLVIHHPNRSSDTSPASGGNGATSVYRHLATNSASFTQGRLVIVVSAFRNSAVKGRKLSAGRVRTNLSGACRRGGGPPGRMPAPLRPAGPVAVAPGAGPTCPRLSCPDRRWRAGLESGAVRAWRTVAAPGRNISIHHCVRRGSPGRLGERSHGRRRRPGRTATSRETPW